MSAQPSWPCYYRARFSQTRILGTRELTSSGRLFQDCDRGLVWRVERPVSDVSIYSQGGNFLRLQRGGSSGIRITPIDGLAERRIGSLLGDLFSGDVVALDRDFAHSVQADDSVRLTPRDASLASRLTAIELSGTSRTTRIRVLVPGNDTVHALLEMTLADFSLADGRDGCTATFTDSPGQLEGCDALRYPARWLQRARDTAQ